MRLVRGRLAAVSVRASFGAGAWVGGTLGLVIGAILGALLCWFAADYPADKSSGSGHYIEFPTIASD